MADFLAGIIKTWEDTGAQDQYRCQYQAYAGSKPHQLIGCFFGFVKLRSKQKLSGNDAECFSHGDKYDI